MSGPQLISLLVCLLLVSLNVGVTCLSYGKKGWTGLPSSNCYEIYSKDTQSGVPLTIEYCYPKVWVGTPSLAFVHVTPADLSYPTSYVEKDLDVISQTDFLVNVTDKVTLAYSQLPPIFLEYYKKISPVNRAADVYSADGTLHSRFRVTPHEYLLKEINVLKKTTAASLIKDLRSITFTNVSKDSYIPADILTKLNGLTSFRQVFMSNDPIAQYIRRHYIYPCIIMVLCSSVDLVPSGYFIMLAMYAASAVFLRANIHLPLIAFKTLSMTVSHAVFHDASWKIATQFMVVTLFQGAFMFGAKLASTASYGFLICMLVSSLAPVVPLIGPLAAGKWNRNDASASMQSLLFTFAFIEFFYTVATLGGGELSKDLIESAELPMCVLSAFIYMFAGTIAGIPAYHDISFVLTKRAAILNVCEYSDCDNITPSVEEDIVSTIQSYQALFYILLMVGLVALLYAVGMYIFMSRSVKIRHTPKNAIYYGACRFVSVFDVFVVDNNVTDFFLVILTVAKMSLMIQSFASFIIMYTTCGLLVYFLSFNADPLDEKERKKIFEATVSRLTDVLDMDKIKVVQNHVIEVTYSFADQSTSTGKAILLSPYMFLTVRHVGDPDLTKRIPDEVTITNVDGRSSKHPVINNMYFPKIPGSDGFMVTVVDGAIPYYTKGSTFTYTTENSGQYWYLLMREHNPSRVLRRFFDRNSECVKVVINTEAGDSGTPVVTTKGEIRGLHGGACTGGKWNFFYPFNAESVAWLRDIQRQNVKVQLPEALKIPAKLRDRTNTAAFESLQQEFNEIVDGASKLFNVPDIKGFNPISCKDDPALRDRLNSYATAVVI